MLDGIGDRPKATIVLQLAIVFFFLLLQHACEAALFIQNRRSAGFGVGVNLRVTVSGNRLLVFGTGPSLHFQKQEACFQKQLHADSLQRQNQHSFDSE